MAAKNRKYFYMGSFRRSVSTDIDLSALSKARRNSSLGGKGG